MGPNFSETLNLSSSGEIKQDHKHKEKFLRFALFPDTKLMLPLRQISAVLKIPYGQIIPIPEMPSWVMGVHNWRGEIIWMIDLGHLIGLTRWDQQSFTSSNHQVIIIHPRDLQKATKTSGEMIGLIVTQVEDIELCDPQEIYSPPASAVSQELAPFLQGYWLKTGGDIFLAIDGEAILAAMPKE
jgi:positive phototaxis protein PixI